MPDTYPAFSSHTGAVNRRRRIVVVALAIAPFAVAGCAAPHTPTSDARTAAPSPAAVTMAPGETMTPGQTMAPPETGTPSAAANNRPSAAAQEICSDEIRGQVTKVLRLSAPPVTNTSWANHIYTCTYHLSLGPLVLSVKDSPTPTAAHAHYTTLRAQLAPTTRLLGLGETAYGTTTGIAVVLKDNDTLKVDATALPAQFGSQQQKRTDLAYEIASDVLGCWTGDS
jgi:hypothetical protein